MRNSYKENESIGFSHIFKALDNIFSKKKI